MKIGNSLILNKSFRVMGTDVQIEIILAGDEQREKAVESLKKAQAIFEEKELIFSRFSEQSELSRINRRLNQETEISPEMKEVLGLCLKFNQIMEGYFDPRMIENLEKIGYAQDFRTSDPNDLVSHFPQLEIIEKKLEGEFKLDETENKIWVSRRIDTTGIAKGYAVDRVANFLQNEGWKNFLVDAGGDMFASGRGGNGEGWLVGVEGLENASVRIRLKNEGIATSGISRKRWVRGGRKVHHLINPKNPQEFSHDLKTVTVVDAKTVEADGRAKSLFLMGREEGLKFANREGIKCLFLDYKNNVYVSEKFKENLV